MVVRGGGDFNLRVHRLTENGDVEELMAGEVERARDDRDAGVEAERLERAEERQKKREEELARLDQSFARRSKLRTRAFDFVLVLTLLVASALLTSASRRAASRSPQIAARRAAAGGTRPRWRAATGLRWCEKGKARPNYVRHVKNRSLVTDVGLMG